MQWLISAISALHTSRLCREALIERRAEEERLKRTTEIEQKEEGERGEGEETRRGGQEARAEEDRLRSES